MAAASKSRGTFLLMVHDTDKDVGDIVESILRDAGKNIKRLAKGTQSLCQRLEAEIPRVERIIFIVTHNIIYWPALFCNAVIASLYNFLVTDIIIVLTNDAPSEMFNFQLIHHCTNINIDDRHMLKNLTAERKSPESKLSEKCLMELSQQVGSSWEELGLYLGMSSADLDNIKASQPHQPSMWAFQILLYWQQRRNHGDLDSSTQLMNALVDAGRTDLAEKVTTYIKGQHNQPYSPSEVEAKSGIVLDFLIHFLTLPLEPRLVPSGGYQYDVFICHSTKDKSIAKTIEGVIKDSGSNSTSSWKHADFPLNGTTDHSVEKVRQVIEKSRCMIIIISKHLLNEEKTLKYLIGEALEHYSMRNIIPVWKQDGMAVETTPLMLRSFLMGEIVTTDSPVLKDSLVHSIAAIKSQSHESERQALSSNLTDSLMSMATSQFSSLDTSPSGSLTGDLAPQITQGYLREIFNTKVDDKLTCCHCMNVLRVPTQSMCGHRFCRECFQQLVEFKVQCKRCKDEDGIDTILTIEQSFPDKATAKDLRKMDVHCMNQGCAWKGKLKDFEDHIATNCEFVMDTCSNECGQTMLRKDIPAHLDSACELREKPCKFCRTFTKFKLMDEHFKVCRKFPLKCQLCGKKKIPRDQMALHQDEQTGDCGHVKIRCQFGCPEVLEKVNIEEHNKENTAKHLEMLLEGMSTLGLDQNTNINVGQIQNVADNMSSVHERVMKLEERLHQQSGAAGATSGAEVSGVAPMAGASGSNIGEDIVKRVEAVERKVTSFESVSAVLNREVGHTTERIKQHERDLISSCDLVEKMKSKINTLERLVAVKDTTIRELEKSLEELEMVSYDGTLTWCVQNVTRKRQEARSGMTASFFSQPFYSDRFGYKMCLRLYMDGDGLGRRTHMSLYFILMKGPSDGIQR